MEGVKHYCMIKHKKKEIKQPHYRPGKALRAPGV